MLKPILNDSGLFGTSGEKLSKLTEIVTQKWPKRGLQDKESFSWIENLTRQSQRNLEMILGGLGRSNSVERLPRYKTNKGLNHIIGVEGQNRIWCSQRGSRKESASHQVHNIEACWPRNTELRTLYFRLRSIRSREVRSTLLSQTLMLQQWFHAH